MNSSMNAGKRGGRNAGVKPEENRIYNGIFMFPNGDKYEGDYRHLPDGTIERSGNGRHTSQDETVYEGEWANDKMNGRGRLEHPSGCVYEGSFKDNTFDGRGKYAWPEGCAYEGGFVENRLEGYGEFKDMEGQTWTGQFDFIKAAGLKFKLDM